MREVTEVEGDLDDEGGKHRSPVVRGGNGSQVMSTTLRPGSAHRRFVLAYALTRDARAVALPTARIHR